MAKKILFILFILVFLVLYGMVLDTLFLMHVQHKEISSVVKEMMNDRNTHMLRRGK